MRMGNWELGIGIGEVVNLYLLFLIGGLLIARRDFDCDYLRALVLGFLAFILLLLLLLAMIKSK